MKKVFLAALALFALVGCKEAKTAENANDVQATEVTASDVAYVQVDVIITQCDMYLSEGTALQEKTEKAQQSLARKEQKLQNEMVQLQEKYQKGLITTRDAQAKEQELQKKVVNYQESAQKEIKALEEENIVFTNRMNDLVQRAINEINANGTYKMIINASALLDADESLNITEVVLAKVNELYKADKEAK